MQIKLRKCPPLVGRKEAAALLGIAQQNLGRVQELPKPLNERGIDGFAVSAGPLWPLAEVTEVARKRAA